MLVDDIKHRLRAAMKQRQTVEKEILRVVLGEIQTVEAREARALTDEQAAQMIRKLLKSNRETLAVTTDAAQAATLEEENRVLESLLPKTLGVDAIVQALAPVADALRSAPGEGPATGIAMKHLKSTGAAVEGKAVAEAVRRLRST
jgi:uncharacterized protein